mmetsp:Transcript_3878/g.13448  ORF Transcript_3878/g.13448 Transcript_3878/m.13448 type:complete len:241 (+) Transcript_3878:1468-2190(+)
MRVVSRDLVLVQRDVRVVLLVHVEVLHEPALEEVVEPPPSRLELVQVFARRERLAVRDDQKRPAHSPAVARDVQTTALRRVHADELADFPDSTQVPHVAREAIRRAVNAQDGPVEEHDGAARRVQLRAANQRQRLRAQRERELPQRLLLVVRGDVRHEREVFHEPARLPLRGVARAEHAPLRRLQRARAGDFPRLFKLARNPRHHPQRAYERQATQDLRHALPLHAKPLHRPVSAADRVL